jgi:hypothetical protein
MVHCETAPPEPRECPAAYQPPGSSVESGYCCANQDNSYCVHGNGGLGPCEAGWPLYCDDASDCESGFRCCESGREGFFECRASCDGARQLCQTDGECSPGQSCSGIFGMFWVGGFMQLDGQALCQ